MLQRENLISILDRFNAAVYLKDLNGRYLSMNSSGLNFMDRSHGPILGQTAHDLFDLASANQMAESDRHALYSKELATALLRSKDKKTGKNLPMFSAKTVIRAPLGEPLGIVGISLVNCENADLYAEACRLLPHFVRRKHTQLLSSLLELKTIGEFMNAHRLH